MICDYCGKEIKGKYAIADNDLILCPECFIEVYWDSTIEEILGVGLLELKKEEVDDDEEVFGC